MEIASVIAPKGLMPPAPFQVIVFATGADLIAIPATTKMCAWYAQAQSS